jgi:hypothetical protein
MRRYRLQRDVPVVWVSDLRKFRLPSPVPVEPYDLLKSFRLTWKRLKRATLLDAPPVLLGSAVLEGLEFVQVRVEGREGLVEKERLQAALPGWDVPPPSLP